MTLYCGLVGGDLMVGFDGNRASAALFRLELRAARSRLATDQSFGLPLMRRFKADMASANLAKGQPRNVPWAT